MKIYIVRHGKALHNALEQYNVEDEDLTDIGISQANELRDKIKNIKLFFKRIYSFLDVLKNKEYRSVLVVAHSGVSKAFSAYFEGINNGMFLNRGLKNCEIKEYQL